MERFKKRLATMAILLVSFQIESLQATYTPWDALVSDSWIETAAAPAQIYSVNGSAYDLNFATAKNNGSARGLNSLKFSDGLVNTGHLKSYMFDSSFYIDNTGGQDFTNFLLMVAIDADTLPGDFSLSLTARGQNYHLDPSTDFAYYSHPEYDTGRPTGYHSATNPTRDSIAYDFATGFVSVIDLTCVSPDAPILSATMVEIDYNFDNLPGRAVFSGYAVQFESTQVTHTNRATTDMNDPVAVLSSFEVIPEPSIIALIVCGIGIIAKRKRFA